MTYTGPERRRGQQHDVAARLGRWLFDRAALVAGMIVLVYVALAVLTFGIVESNRRAETQIDQLEQLLERQQRGAEDGAAVVRCILAEMASLRINNAAAHDFLAGLHGVGDVPPPDGGADVTVSNVPDPEAACRRANELFRELPKEQGGSK